MPLWKDPRSGKYRIQFQHLGKRYSKTGFASKKEAEKWQILKVAELDREAKTPPKESNSSLQDFSPLTLGDLMLKYMAVAERTLSFKTLSYRRTVFRRFLTKTGDIPAAGVTPDMVETYLLSRPTNNNFNKDRIEIHRLYSWGCRRQMVDKNPVYPIEKLTIEHEKKAIPTPDEMAKILMAAGPDRPLLLILFHTMARIDEILRLRWEDVNFTEKAVRLWTRKRRGGAWEHDWMEMNEDLEAILWGLWKKREQDEFVFFNSLSRNRYLYRPKIMKTICKRAGVPHYSFHCIRHFVASFLHDKMKQSVSVVSKLLRHKNKATTEKYLQTIDPEVRGTMKLLEGNILEVLHGVAEETQVAGGLNP